MPEQSQMTGVSVGDLRRSIVPRRIPDSELYRRYYGRGLSPAQIEQAIRQAEIGLMADITDLEDESISLDLHASGVLSKRFGALSTLDWDVTPATGSGLDEKLAETIADETRQQFKQIPFFGERLFDLAWGLFHGRSALEAHWVMTSGRLRWKIESLQWIAPRRLSFGPERELRLIDTYQHSGYFREDGWALRDFPGKFIWWTPRLFATYPERDGLGPRLLYWSFFKRFSWRMRMILTETFALPWRIMEQNGTEPANWDQMKEAAALLENLGQDSTAYLPHGVKLNMVFPDGTVADLFQMTNGDVDKQTSKLVLGNTGTTDGDESNRANSIIQKGEQDIGLVRDAQGLSGRMQQQLTRPFVELNWGAEGLAHCPLFGLRAELPRDVEKELGHAKTIIDFGLSVAEKQLRELTGWRVPDEDEAYVTRSGSGGVDSFGNPLPAQIAVVDPNAPEDLDDAARGSADLEEGGEDEATENALRDILAACNVRVEARPLAALSRMPKAIQERALLRMLEMPAEESRQRPFRG